MIRMKKDSRNWETSYKYERKKKKKVKINDGWIPDDKKKENKENKYECCL